MTAGTEPARSSGSYREHRGHEEETTTTNAGDRRSRYAALYRVRIAPTGAAHIPRPERGRQREGERGGNEPFTCVAFCRDSLT